jgi:hypothetical protein
VQNNVLGSSISGLETQALLIISLTECSSGTIQKLSFEVNTAIELKNITAASDSTGTLG